MRVSDRQFPEFPPDIVDMVESMKVEHAKREASGRPWITLYADYAEWPLWDRRGLLHEDALPLSQPTKERIKAWLNAYDDPRSDWPLWEPPPGLGPDDDEAAWVLEGERIRDQIQDELGDAYDVYCDT
jgi:hypothetical protein